MSLMHFIIIGILQNLTPSPPKKYAWNHISGIYTWESSRFWTDFEWQGYYIVSFEKSIIHIIIVQLGRRL
jgi:hypothetical protein